MSETVDDDAKPSPYTRRATQCVKNDVSGACTGKAVTTEIVSDSSIRAKRARSDVDLPQMRKLSKQTDIGGQDSNKTGRDVKEDPPVIKLPRMPMIRYGKYWYRARIKQETRESVYVEFTGL